LGWVGLGWVGLGWVGTYQSIATRSINIISVKKNHSNNIDRLWFTP